jgi:hypothetical protein
MVALLGAGGYFTYKTVRVYQAKETFELVYKVSTVIPHRPGRNRLTSRFKVDHHLLGAFDRGHGPCSRLVRNRHV